MEIRNSLSIRKDNRGVTLIELLISMAISSIVIAMVVLIISAGSRQYSAAQNEVDLQMQAQTVTNQMEDLLVEAYWLEKKTNVIVGGTTDPAANVTAYVIYTNQNSDPIPDLYVIFYDSIEKELYFVDGVSASQVNSLSTSLYSKANNLMATDVSAFTLDTSSSTLTTNQETTLEIAFTNATSDVVVDKTIAFRNQAAPSPIPGG